jgi:imidazole glycerol phosphate synthase glutamine amidotransferase subunit
MKIGIIDYKSGNLKSIENMLKHLGQQYFVASTPEQIQSADKLIFPGQGHFEQATNALKQSGLIDGIKNSIAEGKPFLGICLGLQILFEKSEEAPDVYGLGVLEGDVLKFQQGKIPQIGWNQIKTTSNNSILEDEHYYFVNSYYVKPKDEQIVSSYCNYHMDFAASVEKKNLIAVQFHPEKSGEAGIRVFEKWLKL